MKPILKYLSGLIAGLVLSVAAIPEPAAASNYALIINSGCTRELNFKAQWQGARTLYHTLVEKRLVPASQIYGVNADGIDPAPDYNIAGLLNDRYESSDPYADNGMNLAFGYDASVAGLQNAIAVLTKQTTATDQLFIYITGHGTQDDGLCLWDGNFVTGDQFASWLEKIAAPKTVVANFCYAGAFIRDLYYHSPRICGFATTDAWHESNTFRNHNSFANHFAKRLAAPNSLTHHQAFSQARSADTQNYFSGQFTSLDSLQFDCHKCADWTRHRNHGPQSLANWLSAFNNRFFRAPLALNLEKRQAYIDHLQKPVLAMANDLRQRFNHDDNEAPDYIAWWQSSENRQRIRLVTLFDNEDDTWVEKFVAQQSCLKNGF